MSQSKKTIVINRGTADGLNPNEHASFIVDSGIVAKGIVTKVSEFASLWQIYKIYQGDYLSKDKILNLKMITPVKLSLDSNKQLVEDDIDSKIDPRDPNPGKIALVEGANDLGSFEELEVKNYQKRSSKNKEIYALLGGSLTRSTKAKEDKSLYFKEDTLLTYRGDLVLGFEFWSQSDTGSFSKISIAPFLQGYYEKRKTSFSEPWFYTELGGGGGLQLNFNFYHPGKLHQAIPFVFVKGIFFYGQGLYQEFFNEEVDKEMKLSVMTYGGGGGLGLRYSAGETLGIKMGVEILYLFDSKKNTEETSLEYKQQDLKVFFFGGLSFRF